MRSVTSQSVLMLGCRVGLLGLGFGNTVLTARLLRPEGRGTYAMVMVALGLLSLLVGSLGTGVALSAAHEEADSSRRTTSASIGLAFTVSLLLLPLALGWQPGASWHVAATVAFASAPLMLFISYVQFACMGRGRFGWFAALQLLQPALLVILGVALMVIVPLGLLGAMLAWTVSWALTSPLALCALLALGWRFRLTELMPWQSRRLIAFAAGAGIFNGLSYFTNRSLLFLIQGVLGSGAAGVFSVTAQLAEPVNYMSAALSTVAYPRLAPSSTRPAEARRFIQIAALVSVLGSSAIMILAVVLLVPIFGREYQMAIFPLPLLLLGYVIMSGRDIATFWYVHEQKSYAFPIRGAVAAFVVALGVAVPLVMWFGTVGAACGAGAAGVTLMTVLLAGLRQRGLALRSLLRLDPAVFSASLDRFGVRPAKAAR
jgi:O-antigen/teichoic acid export membrane protein